MSFWKTLGKCAVEVGQQTLDNMEKYTNNYKEFESYSNDELVRLSRSWDSSKSTPAKAILAKRSQK